MRSLKVNVLLVFLFSLPFFIWGQTAQYAGEGAGYINYKSYKINNGDGDQSQYGHHPNNASDFDTLFDTANSNTTLTHIGRDTATKAFSWPWSNILPRWGNDWFGWEISFFIKAPETGVYELSLTSDDKSDLFIDDVNTAWNYNGDYSSTATISLTQGQVYEARIRYQQGVGGLNLYFKWKTPSMDDGAALVYPSADIYSYDPTAGPRNGTGTENDPYEIETFDDLIWLTDDSSRWDKHYLQTADIDASNSTNLNSGAGWKPIGSTLSNSFSGVYDGQNHTINNLSINRPTEEYVGFFGYTYTGDIKNLRFEDASVTGKKNVGIAIGGSYTAVLSNLHATGTVVGDHRTGGLMGLLYHTSTLSLSSFVGTVTGNQGDTSNYNATGGLVGKSEYKSTVSTSWSKGSVSGNYLVGGLIGQNAYGSIYNSYSRANVAAASNAVGGLLGWNQTDEDVNGPVNNYSTGTVNLSSSSNGIGGLIGYHSECNSCLDRGSGNYWDTSNSGQSTDEAPSTISSGLTDVAAKLEASYTNWDFDSIWIKTGNLNEGYPSLRGNNDIDLQDIRFDVSTNQLIVELTTPIYEDNESPPTTSDFSFSLENPNGIANGPAVSLVSSSALSLSISSDKKTISFTVSFTGTFDGDEELRIIPTDDNYQDDSIYLSHFFTQNDIPPTVTLQSDDQDGIIAHNQVVSISATFSSPMQASPTLSIIASDTYENQYLNLVDNAILTAVDSATWNYSWTVNTTNTFDHVSITVSGTNSSGIAYSDTTSLSFTIDNSPPGIETLNYISASNNIELIFNEGVYGSFTNQSATASITAANFNLTLSGGTAQLNSAQPTSVTNSGTSYLLGLDLGGFISGDEELFINPDSTIYDIVGNQLSYEQNSYSVHLIDNTAPYVSRSELANDNSSITLHFSEMLAATSMANFDSSTASYTQINIPTKTTATGSWEPWTEDIDINIPEGYIVSKVSFAFDAKDQGWGGTNANATIKLNNTEIGKAKLTHSYQSFTEEETGSFPDFDYDGINQLKFYFMGWPGWSSTTKDGVLTIYYSPVNIEENDFVLSLSGGTASLSSATPASIVVSDTKVTLGISISGTPNGQETLNLSPASNALYDFAGNVVSPTSIDFTLYDLVASFITSTTLSETNTQVLLHFSEELNTFSNWGGNEPNDMGTENHAHLTNGGTFNDHRTNQTFPSIVEVDQIRSSLSTLTHIGDFNGHSYFELTTFYTWEDAKVIVDGFETGYLAIIGSDEENEFLKNQSLGDIWIGLYQDLNDPNYSEPAGGWKWVNGTPANIDGFNLDAIQLSINGGTASLTTVTPPTVTEVNSLTYLVELPLSGAVSGEEIITIDLRENSLYDIDGNALSTTQSNNTVQLKDTTAPILSLSDDQLDNHLSGGETVVIQAASSEPLMAAPVLIFSDQSSGTMTTTDSATLWEYSWTVPSELNGTISVTVSGYDADNNPNSDSATLAYVIDNTSATAVLTTDQNDIYLKAGESITVTATFDEAVEGNCVLAIAGVNSNTTVVMSATSSSLWSTNWAIPSNWPEGEFSFSIATANDTAGNAYAGTASASFSLDTSSPTVELQWDNTNTTFKGGDIINFTATFNEALGSAPLINIDQIVENTAFSTTASENLWAYQFTVPQALNTTTSVSLNAFDKAGNELQYLLSDTFSIDSSAPLLEELSLSSDNSSLELRFDDMIFNDQGSSTLALDSFSFGISGGNLTAENIVISEVTVDQKTVSLALNYTANVSGDETLLVGIKENAVFDLTGNAVISQQTTNSIQLNDTTAPYLSAIALIDNNSLRLRFNEPITASQNTTTSLGINNFNLASNLASSTAISSQADEVLQEGEEVTLKFSLNGPLTAGEKLIVQLASTIYDLNGNATSTLFINNSIELILDTDQDGVPDETDLCPNTVEGANVDENGCSFDQRDDDLDGIANGQDLCADTPEGETVDNNGCSALQRDSDQDGVASPFDQCPETPEGQIVDENGCGVQDQDQDLDGVPNDLDACPDTPLDERVDEKGCAEIQIDADLDGIPNEDDLCPQTPFGVPVDENGCSEKEAEIKQEQADDDQDGVINILDRCPNTLAGTNVDVNGCSLEAATVIAVTDADFDGVENEKDLCPNTEKGVLVNAFGCPLSEIDSDFDKVSDALDRCPNTPLGEEVDEYGCSASQKENDADLDGVMNEMDRCPATPFGAEVDQYGCTLAQAEADLDLDGVRNEDDLCPATLLEDEVDENGCSEKQRDDDQDGVPNGLDRCADTPLEEKVDVYGCSDNQLDTDDDNDGVKNSLDKCPNTPAGVAIDENGCPYKAAKIYGQSFERIENGRDDDVSNIKILLGEIVVEDTNKAEDVYNNTVALSILEGEDAALFNIEGRKLHLVGGLDFEEKTVHRFTVQATNDKGITSEKEIVLYVQDIPNSMSRTNFNILVFNVQNEQNGSKVSYDRYFNPKAERGVGKWKIKKKIVGGNDAGLFEIKTEVLSDGKNEVFNDYLDFVTPPDYENPMDHNRDNIYEVDVININTEDGDSTQPIPVTQTNIVVPENNPTAIELQSIPASPSDDTDGDGINDIVDNSPFVPNANQADSDGDGVGDVTDDADHDGVWNPFDECNDTPYDTIVDAKGCAIFYLSPTSFNVSTSEKCAGQNAINIGFDNNNYQYNIAIDGISQNQTPISSSSWSIPELSTGDYEVCITVEGQTEATFQRCYNVNITDPQPLSVYGKSSNSGKTINFSLEGGKVYTITHNGQSFQTDQNQVEIDLANGINQVKITTGIECQGVFLENYFNSAEVFLSPLPFNDQLSIFVGGQDTLLNFELYTTNGRLIQTFQKKLHPTQRTILLNTSHLRQGTYLLKTVGETTLTSELIIKE